MPTGIQSAMRKVLSVSDLNRMTRMRLEHEFSNVWVEGEISNLKYHTSGHIYLSLKDSQAQISAAFFSRYNRGLKFQLKDGLQVVALGKVSIYEARGQYQFYIESLEPKGIGALQMAFNQLKEKLSKEGLFDPEHKKPIPKFPKVVGVVTSATGAAIRDILNVIQRRFSGTHLILNPVQVQGEGAAEQIARAIDEMNAMGEADVLIVGRGGGSLEDLWAFNEEAVARAVFRSNIPVISAVGHEIDWTICDFVADLRAPTPSAAAELVVQNREELLKRVRELKLRIVNAVKSGLLERKRDLEGLSTSYAFKQPMALIQQFLLRHDELSRQLQNYQKAYLGEKKQAFSAVTGQLKSLSPLGVLERGYSISLGSEGRLLKDIKDIRVGDIMTTRLQNGTIISKVTQKEKYTFGEGR